MVFVPNSEQKPFKVRISFPMPRRRRKDFESTVWLYPPIPYNPL